MIQDGCFGLVGHGADCREAASRPIALPRATRPKRWHDQLQILATACNRQEKSPAEAGLGGTVKKVSGLLDGLDLDDQADRHQE